MNDQLSRANREESSDEALASDLFDMPDEVDLKKQSLRDDSIFPEDPLLQAQEPKTPEDPPIAEIIDLSPSVPNEADTYSAPEVLAEEDMRLENELFSYPADGGGENALPSVQDTDESISLFGAPDETDGAAYIPAFDTGDEILEASDAKDAPLAPPDADFAEGKPNAVPRTTPEMLALYRHAEKRAAISAKLRFCIATLLAMMLAVLELFSVFGVDVTVPLGISRVRGGAALLDLQFLLLIGLASWKTIAVGFRYLFTAHFRGESVLSLSVLLVVAYDIYLYVIGAIDPILLALPLAIVLVLSIWIELSECEIRRHLFALLARRGKKNAAIVKERDGRSVMTVSQVDRIDGFDERLSSFSENAQYRLVLFFFSLLISAGAAIATAFAKGEIPQILASALSVYLLSAPFVAILSRRMYFVALSRACIERSVALIGESTVNEAAVADCFSIEDSEAFSESETRIRFVNVFHDSRLDEILCLISGVFRQIGGPLAAVLAKTGKEAGVDRSVEILSVEEDGLTASSEGRAVYIGSEAFLMRMGCSLACDIGADPTLKSDRMCIMYCAIEDELKAKFYLEYTLDSVFESRVDQLRRFGIKTEIRTFDPNLTAEYVAAISCVRSDMLRVRKQTSDDLPEEGERGSESGLFTFGKPRGLLGALLACRQYLRASRRLALCMLVEVFAGGGLFLLLHALTSRTLVPIFGLSLYLVMLSAFSLYGAIRFGKRAFRHDREIAGEADRQKGRSDL